jgi:2-oxoglutarate dehydrogenase complex dehydrogenase (E1) component-like enzyme
MSPKEILRKPISVLNDLLVSSFSEILNDNNIANPNSVEKVLLCSGKVYYDLMNERAKLHKEQSVAIIRVEQLYPFKDDMARNILSTYSNAKKIVWVQEEPKNQGSWFFIAPRLMEVLSSGQSLSYAGRPEAASPATGFGKKHEYEKQQFLAIAFQ